MSYDFLLTHGRSMDMVSTLNTGTKKLGECYRNASTRMTQGDYYCEGLGMPTDLIPLHHAWNACKGQPSKFYDNTWKTGGEYFGVMFRTDFVLDMQYRTRHFSIFESLYNLKMSPSECMSYLESGIHPDFLTLKDSLDTYKS